MRAGKHAVHETGTTIMSSIMMFDNKSITFSETISSRVDDSIIIKNSSLSSLLSQPFERLFKKSDLNKISDVYQVKAFEQAV
jgi:hypothetical protein